MGDAKNRDRKLGRSYLDRINAAREREVARSNRLARELEAYAAEVQAQAKRIGMALGTTQIMAEIPVVPTLEEVPDTAPNAAQGTAPDVEPEPGSEFDPTAGARLEPPDGSDQAATAPAAVQRRRTETHPARVVLIGLDALLERLGMMERAVDAACPEHGENPACECVSCQIRKACGMMFKTAPAALGPVKSEVAAPGPAPVAATEPEVTSGYLQVEPFVEPEAAVPAASAVPADPDMGGPLFGDTCERSAEQILEDAGRVADAIIADRNEEVPR